MRIIGLPQGKFAQVDDGDFEYLNQWKWHTMRGDYPVKKEKRVYVDGKITRKTVYMHVLIMAPTEGFEVDHIDGNPLNNQRCNLRICTHQENLRNQKLQKHGTSKYKGVFWNTRRGGWHASICVNKKSKYLGVYTNEAEAAIAYNNAAKDIFGEFAKLNKVA